VEVARHHRTYDRHHFELDPAHAQALMKVKRRAFDATPTGRLAFAVPESEVLIDLAFGQGESAGTQTAQLRKLLDMFTAPVIGISDGDTIRLHTYPIPPLNQIRTQTFRRSRF
jgi:hypothetical protein